MTLKAGVVSGRTSQLPVLSFVLHCGTGGDDRNPLLLWFQNQYLYRVIKLISLCTVGITLKDYQVCILFKNRFNLISEKNILQ